MKVLLTSGDRKIESNMNIVYMLCFKGAKEKKR